MKLQLALDTSLKKGLKICEKVKKHIDIIELGTPLIKAEGVKAVKKFKKFRKPIMADLKTMDTGFLEAEMAFKAGADLATVCAASSKNTIFGAVKAAKKYKKKIVVDFIGVRNMKKRLKEISHINADYFEIHTGIDLQKKGESPLVYLKKVIKIVNSKKISVAGGINLKSIDSFAKLKPAIIVVGSAITSSKNPGLTAKELKERIK